MIYNVKFTLLKGSAKIQFFVKGNTHRNLAHGPQSKKGLASHIQVCAIANAVDQC